MNRRALLLGFLTLPITARLKPPALTASPFATGTASAERIFLADAALADLTCNGGLLSSAQAKRFFELLTDETYLLSEPRRVEAPMAMRAAGFRGRLAS